MDLHCAGKIMIEGRNAVSWQKYGVDWLYERLWKAFASGPFMNFANRNVCFEIL